MKVSAVVRERFGRCPPLSGVYLETRQVEALTKEGIMHKANTSSQSQEACVTPKAAHMLTTWLRSLNSGSATKVTPRSTISAAQMIASTLCLNKMTHQPVLSQQSPSWKYINACALYAERQSERGTNHHHASHGDGTPCHGALSTLGRRRYLDRSQRSGASGHRNCVLLSQLRDLRANQFRDRQIQNRHMYGEFASQS